MFTSQSALGQKNSPEGKRKHISPASGVRRADIRTLQGWLGHRDINSTMVYLKGVQSKDALAKVNAGAVAHVSLNRNSDGGDSSSSG
jgi:hypothetical protein